MKPSDPEMLALMKALAEAPKRDNSAYHAALAATRAAFAEAEGALGAPLSVKVKTRRKRNGKYVLKLVFGPAD